MTCTLRFTEITLDLESVYFEFDERVCAEKKRMSPFSVTFLGPRPLQFQLGPPQFQPRLSPILQPLITGIQNLSTVTLHAIVFLTY